MCICDKITIKINCKSYAYMYKSIHLTRDGKDNEYLMAHLTSPFDSSA